MDWAFWFCVGMTFSGGLALAWEHRSKPRTNEDYQLAGISNTGLLSIPNNGRVVLQMRHLMEGQSAYNHKTSGESFCLGAEIEQGVQVERTKLLVKHLAKATTPTSVFAIHIADVRRQFAPKKKIVSHVSKTLTIRWS